MIIKIIPENQFLPNEFSTLEFVPAVDFVESTQHQTQLTLSCSSFAATNVTLKFLSLKVSFKNYKPSELMKQNQNHKTKYYT